MLSIFLTLILAVTVGLYFQLSTIYEPYVPIHKERAPVETVWGPVQLNPVWRGKKLRLAMERRIWYTEN